jgi:spore coat protein CotH
MRSAVVRAFVLAIVFAGAAAGESTAQTAADLFDSGTLQDVRLFVNARDLALLHSNYKENTFYPAELEWRGMRVRNIGIRSRGNGSRNPIKLGLQVDFDRYVGGQTFLGLAALVLDNVWQDPALLRERTAMALFARMGHPTPRESFARVWINDDYQGVYAIVEDLDAVFAARALADPDAFVFEYHYVRPFYGESLGDAVTPYEELFEARTHERDAEAVLYGPIRDLFDRINDPDDESWRLSVEQYVDLEDFVTTVAIENYLSELDGLLGYAGMNNFYLYRSASLPRHRFIVWDRDNAFQAADASVMLRADENVLFRKAMSFSDLRGLYLTTLDRCARLSAQGRWLETEITRMAALIDGAVRADSLKQFSNEQYDEAIAELVKFARSRPRSVVSQVRSLR